MEFFDETFVPSLKDAEKAKAFSRTLARGIAPDSRVTLQREGDDGEASAGESERWGHTSIHSRGVDHNFGIELCWHGVVGSNLANASITQFDFWAC